MWKRRWFVLRNGELFYYKSQVSKGIYNAVTFTQKLKSHIIIVLLEKVMDKECVSFRSFCKFCSMMYYANLREQFLWMTRLG